MRSLVGASLAVVVVGVMAASASQAGMASVVMGGAYRVPVVSYAERPFLTVVRQQYDYSCGSAALATLLTYHYDTPIAEEEVFKAMFEVGDQERIQEVGFSLLDMKKYLASRGLPADGYKIPLELVAEGGIPAITLIELRGYRHFVVIKGITEDTVLVGDPALGIKEYERERFSELQVDEIVFVIRDQFDVAEANFNKMEDWVLRRSAAPLTVSMEPRRAEAARLFSLPSQFQPTLRP